MRVQYQDKDVTVVCHYNEKGNKGKRHRLQIRMYGNDKDIMTNVGVKILKLLKRDKKFSFKNISLFNRN